MNRIALIVLFIFAGCAGQPRYVQEVYTIDQAGLHHKVKPYQTIPERVPAVKRCRDTQTGQFAENTQCEIKK